MFRFLFSTVVLYTALAIPVNLPRCGRGIVGPCEKIEALHWTEKNFENSVLDKVKQLANDKPQPITNEKCDDGWTRYGESCYLVDSEKTTFKDAARKCALKGATMFVANTGSEFNAIRMLLPAHSFSWIGLARLDDNTHQEPIWQSIDGIDSKTINWLTAPYKQASNNGWTTVSECVAEYNNPTVDSTSYAYFYPCTALYSSICERNVTIINMLAQ